MGVGGEDPLCALVVLSLVQHAMLMSLISACSCSPCELLCWMRCSVTAGDQHCPSFPWPKGCLTAAVGC